MKGSEGQRRWRSERVEWLMVRSGVKVNAQSMVNEDEEVTLSEGQRMGVGED